MKLRENNKDVVSIVVTTHHEPLWMLHRCLDSCKNQSYKLIEVIIVDDCAEQDGVSDFLNYYCAGDTRFYPIHLPKNVGYVEARNIGLHVTTGEWILVMDADQWLNPTYISNSVHTISGTNYISVSGNEHKIGLDITLCCPCFKGPNDKCVMVGDRIILRDAALAVGGYDNVLVSDVHFAIKLQKWADDHGYEQSWTLDRIESCPEAWILNDIPADYMDDCTTNRSSNIIEGIDWEKAVEDYFIEIYGK